MKKMVLIVGAGFAGTVYARTLAEAGHTVRVIDRRPHVGGNAYDYVDANGVRVHKYGPHIFHTRSTRVLDWGRRFSDWVPYTHRVRALLPDGGLAPLPINLETVNRVLGTRCERADEVAAQLRRVALPIDRPANAAEHLYSQIGRELTDLFFRPYTRKMWALDLEDLAAAVVKRIPLRLDRVDSYYADEDVQQMPADGYTPMFERALDHPGISVELNTAFDRTMLDRSTFCFNAMSIDDYFDYRLGELPYRSLRFRSRTAASRPLRGWTITNFTDDGPLTRETAWQEFPRHIVTDTGRGTFTTEEPCDYRDNGYERYYPVRTADGRYQKVYAQYLELAEGTPDMRFIGRCGTYQYLDMDQVINQSLTGAEEWLKRHG
jgi:UDP-galactopyranose mutase